MKALLIRVGRGARRWWRRRRWTQPELSAGDTLIDATLTHADGRIERVVLYVGKDGTIAGYSGPLDIPPGGQLVARLPAGWV